jgi:hypothetical protein
MVNEEEFAALVQKSANGLLSATQAARIAANTTTELKLKGKVSKEEFQQIFNTHLQAELLPNGKLNDTMLNAVRQVAKTVSPNVYIERVPNWAKEALLSAAEKRQRKRRQILEKAVEAFYYLQQRPVQGYPPWVRYNEWELEQHCEGLDAHNLEGKICEVHEILEFGKCKQKIMKQIEGDVLVAKCNQPRDFDIKTLSPDAQREVAEEVAKRFQPYETHFNALKKASSHLKRILQVYEDALKLKQAQPAPEWIAQKHKDLQKLIKNAEKIVEGDLPKVLHEIIYDRPTDERLRKACILVESYNAIEREVYSAEKQLDKFGVSLEVYLPSLPILPNAVKKALTHPQPNKKSAANILSRFKMGR